MSSAVAVREGVAYGFLSADDPRWEEFDGYHAERGIDPPDRRLAKVACATDSAGRSSFYCLQPKMFAEPLVLHPAHRGAPGVLINLTAMIEVLVEQLVAVSQYVYIVASTESVAKMCEANGMQRVEAPVYVKKVVR